MVCQASEKTSKFVNNMLDRLLFMLFRLYAFRLFRQLARSTLVYPKDSHMAVGTNQGVHGQDGAMAAAVATASTI